MKNYNFKMSNNIKIPVFENFKDSAHLTKDKYEEAYNFALDNPEAFWEKEGKRKKGKKRKMEKKGKKGKREKGKRK